MHYFLSENGQNHFFFWRKNGEEDDHPLEFQVDKAQSHRTCGKRK